MTDDTAATDHLLSTTRAVRRRLDLERPVDPDIVMECLRLAIQAPTGSNKQGWRWLVVTDPDVKAGLGDLYRRGVDHYQAGRAAEEPARVPNPRAQTSGQRLYSSIERSPVLVIPCIEGRAEDMSNADASGHYGSIFPAVWSFQLALRSRGLGSVLTTLHLHYERDAAELLGIPADISQVALLPVAYTVGTDFKPAARTPIEEITYWNHWDQPRTP